MKKAALEPFQRQNLLVKHVYGRDDKDQIARAYAGERGLTEGDVCALIVRYVNQAGWSFRL